MPNMTRTIGCGKCRVCDTATSLLPTHICPKCWAEKQTPWFADVGATPAGDER